MRSVMKTITGKTIHHTKSHEIQAPIFSMSLVKYSIILIPVWIMSMTGCGYSIIGGNPPLPRQAQSIGIYPVENHTFVAGLDTKTNAEIKKLLEANASVEILPANLADLQLTISMNEIKSKSSGLDSLQNAGGVIFYLSGSAEIKERGNGAMIWKEQNLSVEMIESSSNNLVSNSLELSQENLDELSRLFAEKIYHRLFLDF